MFALITGKLAAKSANEVVVDVGGLDTRFHTAEHFYELPEKGTASRFIFIRMSKRMRYSSSVFRRRGKAIFQHMIQVSG